MLWIYILLYFASANVVCQSLKGFLKSVFKGFKVSKWESAREPKKAKESIKRVQDRKESLGTRVFESCFQSQSTCGACWYSNWVKYFQGKATKKAGQIFMISINLLKEQCLFCSSLEHWDRADHSGCLGCGGAGGVVVMLSRQSQWPHSPWPDMWAPSQSTY